MAKPSLRAEARLLDLIEIPACQMTILRVILRHEPISLLELEKQLGKGDTPRLPDGESLAPAVEELVRSGWLRKAGDGSAATYRIAPLQRSGLNATNLILPRRGQTIRLTEILESLEEETAAPEARPAPFEETVHRSREWLKQRFGHGALAVILLPLSIFNAFVLSSLEVVSVSGFIGSLGVDKLPWLWVVETVISLFLCSIYFQMADRLSRPRLIQVLVAGLAGIYLLVAVLFALHLPASALYTTIYLLKDQQIILYPLAFWNLANSLYSLSEARKIFPLFVGVEMVGGLIGYGLFSLPKLLGGRAIFTSADAGKLLTISAVLFILNFLFIMIGVKGGATPKARPATGHVSTIESFREGFALIKDVKFFRSLALAVTFVWAAMNILWYHFYATIEQHSSQAGNFETFYSLYQMASLLVPLLVQIWLSGWLSRKVGVRSAFLGLPFALLVGSAAALLLPGLYPVAAALFLCLVTNMAWDNPNLQSLQNLVPEERRGRVSTLLGNYSYAFGTIIGSLLVGAVVLAGPRMGWSRGLITTIYMGMNVLLAGCALTAALSARRSYGDSLLSWRLVRRSRRADVLEKIQTIESDPRRSP